MNRTTGSTRARLASSGPHARARAFLGVVIVVASFAGIACSKTERSAPAGVSDAAASTGAASVAAPVEPVIPRCDESTCSDKCTCGETGTCKGGHCAREPEWKIEELALGAGSFGCARYTNGRVQCAGQNALGQLGRGMRTPNTKNQSPATVKEVADATRIVAGAAHACALAKDGRVWCWGSGANGELGSGTAEGSSTPRLVAGLADATALWAGNTHTCAIRKSGAVACWGVNDRGQLGDGTKENRSSPVEVKGVAGATRLALAFYHSCAVAKDGLVLCWGQRGAPVGGVAVPLGVPKSDQIGASQDELCVGAAGKVSCFGPSMNKTLTLVPGFTDATQLSGGDGLMCALRKNGTVTCGDWWAASDGKVTDKSADARALAVGGSFECIVGKDDHVACNAALPTKTVIEQL
ncbi:MAG: regulator of chromosome condensation [Myxococcaceae bacterium]|nr:regulator of chromosome condensation [Myxococcaceae bacterium]